MESILITGGTGLIGKHLTSLFQSEGYEVMHLSHSKYSGKVKTFHWDVHDKKMPDEAIASADHIIHLAGASVSERRWTPSFKKEIIDSRVKSAELLYDAMQRIPNRIKTFISASGIGYYGDHGDEWLYEEAPPANDFWGKICKQWEATAYNMEKLNKRVIVIRTGIVLAREGGALPPLVKPLRFGIAPIFGSGKQFYSCIHIDDLSRIYLFAIRNEKMDGVYNGVSPTSVRYKELINAIAEAIGRKKINLPVPMPLLKMAMGEFVETLAYSYRCSSEKIEAAGFSFQHQVLQEALNDILGRRK